MIVLAYWHRPLVRKHNMSMDMEVMLLLAFMVVQKVTSYINPIKLIEVAMNKLYVE